MGQGMTISTRMRWLLAAILSGFVCLPLISAARAQSTNDPQNISLTPSAPDNNSATPLADDAASGDESDEHAGYYYPKPETLEHYVSSAPVLPDSDKVRRQAFVIGLTKQLLGGQYAPAYAIFAKGNQADKLIIVGLSDGQLDTVYRARALLATLTSVARATNFFQQTTHPEEATFFDLMKLLGFKRVTLTDGKVFAHQITVE